MGEQEQIQEFAVKKAAELGATPEEVAPAIDTAGSINRVQAQGIQTAKPDGELDLVTLMNQLQKKGDAQELASLELLNKAHTKQKLTSGEMLAMAIATVLPVIAGGLISGEDGALAGLKAAGEGGVANLTVRQNESDAQDELNLQKAKISLRAAERTQDQAAALGKEHRSILKGDKDFARQQGALDARQAAGFRHTEAMQDRREDNERKINERELQETIDTEDRKAIRKLEDLPEELKIRRESAIKKQQKEAELGLGTNSTRDQTVSDKFLRDHSASKRTLKRTIDTVEFIDRYWGEEIAQIKKLRAQGLDEESLKLEIREVVQRKIEGLKPDSPARELKAQMAFLISDAAEQLMRGTLSDRDIERLTLAIQGGDWAGVLLTRRLLDGVVEGSLLNIVDEVSLQHGAGKITGIDLHQFKDRGTFMNAYLHKDKIADKKKRTLADAMRSSGVTFNVEGE